VKIALYLAPFLAVTVIFLIRAEILGAKKQVYLLKPLSTLLVIAAGAASYFTQSLNPLYTAGILAGLLFSLGGDTALMFQEKRKAFLVGLGLFLLAHIAYTIVFILLGRFTAWDLLTAVVLLVPALGFYRLIQPNLAGMKAPLIFYMVIISVMVSRAFSAFPSPEFGPDQAWMIFLGAVLFYGSDVILASNRFWRPWKYHRLSLVLYYSGQMLIALSASFFN
jgi:uncharacterized membrane protein YhhN